MHRSAAINLDFLLEKLTAIRAVIEI